MAPPPHPIKQLIVKGYGRQYNLRTLVETGTYLGEMVDSARSWFKEIHTIELDPVLAARARRRFKRKKGVFVYEGDSAIVLPTVLGSISAPALFWLDAHYSGGVTGKGARETPVEKELELVLDHPLAGAILIDDARLFGVEERAYPTLEEVADLAASKGRTMSVDTDIIRIV